MAWKVLLYKDGIEVTAKANASSFPETTGRLPFRRIQHIRWGVSIGKTGLVDLEQGIAQLGRTAPDSALRSIAIGISCSSMVQRNWEKKSVPFHISFYAVMSELLTMYVDILGKVGGEGGCLAHLETKIQFNKVDVDVREL